MRAVLIGTGWRSRFYRRIAEALPSLLDIVSVYSNSEERARELSKNGMRCTSSLDEALSPSHDAVIVSTRRDLFYSIMMTLAHRGEFILSETSFLPLREEERNALSAVKGAVMEQYPYSPLFASVLNVKDRLGKIDQLFLSGLHNHHAASVAKAVLGDLQMPKEVLFIDQPSVIIKTGGRGGLSATGESEEYTRKIRILRFERTLLLHDFSTNQYHNYLMDNSIEIRGERGILTFEGLRTVSDDGYPVNIPFSVHRDTSHSGSSLSLSHISLGKDVVYSNPFYPANLNDDEIGIATIIKNIDEGRSYRTIKDGIDDAVLGDML